MAYKHGVYNTEQATSLHNSEYYNDSKCECHNNTLYKI